MGMITNEKKYKTPYGRAEAFEQYVMNGGSHCESCPFHDVKCLGTETKKGFLCYQSWLDMMAPVEKPMNCPYCGSEVNVDEGRGGNGQELFNVKCSYCDYESRSYHSEYEAIAAHNRVCRAVSVYGGEKQ